VRSSTKRERSASTTCAVCGASVQGTQGIRHLRLHVLCMHLLLHLRLHGGQSLMHGESHGWPATSTEGDQITRHHQQGVVSDLTAHESPFALLGARDVIRASLALCTAPRTRVAARQERVALDLAHDVFRPVDVCSREKR
jgi:hypothetical protein